MFTSCFAGATWVGDVNRFRGLHSPTVRPVLHTIAQVRGENLQVSKKLPTSACPVRLAAMSSMAGGEGASSDRR